MRPTLPITAEIMPSADYAWNVVAFASGRAEMATAAFDHELEDAITRAGIALTHPETLTGKILRRTRAWK